MITCRERSPISQLAASSGSDSTDVASLHTAWPDLVVGASRIDQLQARRNQREVV
jgi:hypothetical protein